MNAYKIYRDGKCIGRTNDLKTALILTKLQKATMTTRMKFQTPNLYPLLIANSPCGNWQRAGVYLTPNGGIAQRNRNLSTIAQKRGIAARKQNNMQRCTQAQAKPRTRQRGVIPFLETSKVRTIAKGIAA